MFKSLRASVLVSIIIVSAFALGVVVHGQRRQASAPAATDSLKVLQWRQIGPFRGGRSTAVAGVASQPMVFYFGGVGGGVWKTTDGGINWEPISDGSVFGTASVGAIGLSDSDPNTIYVGMGESPIRGNVSHGDGVYKSTDGGKTWKHIGLEDTRQISRVRVHPRIPTSSTSPRRATCGRRTRIAACFDQRTAVRPGRRFCFAVIKRAPAI
jgi:photosystem II stability/assembly factor-like uncharacterized protein